MRKRRKLSEAKREKSARVHKRDCHESFEEPCEQCTMTRKGLEKRGKR